MQAFVKRKDTVQSPGLFSFFVSLFLQTVVQSSYKLKYSNEQHIVPVMLQTLKNMWLRHRFPKIFDYACLDVKTENWVSENPGIYSSIFSFSTCCVRYLVCSTAVISVFLTQEKPWWVCWKHSFKFQVNFLYRTLWKLVGGSRGLIGG